MPYVLFDPKKLATVPRGQQKRLPFYSYDNLYNYSVILSVFVYDANIVSYTKPEEIPEGMALRFFASTSERDEIAVRERQLSVDDPNNYKDPPWVETNDDGTTVQPAFARSDNCRVMRPKINAEGMLTFFPSQIAAWENRRETTTIGKFLNTLWASYDEIDGGATSAWGRLTDEAIRVWSTAPKKQTAEDVQFSSDPDVIERVYRAGPSSCMSHPVGDYATNGIHPVRAYGNGDLALAYVAKAKDPTKYSQRALVWPAKKRYGRVYGSGALEKWLQELGYTHGTFDGAKMSKIEIEGHDAVVMPYVDYHDYVVESKRGYLKLYTGRTRKHPLFPDKTIQRVPNAKKWVNVWSAQPGTRGSVAIAKPCTKCKTRKAGSDGSSVCGKCRQHMWCCGYCGQYGDKTTERWMTAISMTAASEYLTHKSIIQAVKVGNLSALCHRCCDPDSARYRSLFPSSTIPYVLSEGQATSTEGAASCD